ncbi:polyprenyl synthetase family protein [Sorangium sp. So ce295]|uniref:polyprenyl synthetase family protein n=1 Tax=Sorangium sp. So ce295 TaxID=3133295 RepID=UPI003F606E79
MCSSVDLPGPSSTPKAAPGPVQDIGQVYLEEHRELVLEEIRRIVREGSPGDDRAYRLMLDYPLRRAKGLRPALCIAVCRALGGELEEVLPSAAVVEMYHNAFLIHDDIEDGSLTRRGGPALHRTHGIPAAVNCGDGLLALTLGPLLGNTDRLGLGRALRILDIYARAVLESFEGQAQELSWIDEGTWQLTDADYESMVRRKTCSYSFVAPGLVGAAVARAEPSVEALLVSFLESLGLAFQIQDDVLNLEEGRADYGKELAGDLWEGKRTLMLLHALRSAPEADREEALRILRKPRPTAGSSDVGIADLLREMVDEHVIDEAARAAMLGYLERRAAPPGEKTEGDVLFLRRLIDGHGGIEHAREVARRHAASAEVGWQRLAEVLADSVHTRFIAWLKDYVVQRTW